MLNDIFNSSKNKFIELANNGYSYYKEEKLDMKGLGDLLGSSHKDDKEGGGDMFSSFTNIGKKQESQTNILPQFMQKGLSDAKDTATNVKETIPGFQEEPACAKCCPNLTFKQRLIGFFACAVCGYLLSFIGTLTLIGGPTPTNIRTFAVLYVFGNVVALAATGFLLGPRSQCTKMWHPTRRYSAAFYLIMLIIVFSVAVAKQNVGLVIVLLIIQILAALWYSISYIPFGRKAVKACLKRTICKPCWDVYEENKGGGGGGGGSSA
mmetsp:Transcript_28374/g.28672  ORF Transcript_28374/g.28672 Transcript_28374/m.28672 type:complete len:265 (+) Transcript_28374:117-911(+)